MSWERFEPEDGRRNLEEGEQRAVQVVLALDLQLLVQERLDTVRRLDDQEHQDDRRHLAQRVVESSDGSVGLVADSWRWRNERRWRGRWEDDGDGVDDGRRRLVSIDGLEGGPAAKLMVAFEESDSFECQ